MSLIRQIWGLLALVLVAAFVGSFAVSVHSARDYLSVQLSLKNNDTAQLLALSLSQSQGDATLMELAISSQFDTGFYERIRLLDQDGRVVVDRHADRNLQLAPAWFSRWLSVRPDPGVAQVSDGWRALGTLEVRSQVGYAIDELWWIAIGNASTLGLLGAAAAFVAALGVRRIRRSLDAVVDQAHAIEERRFVTVAEPREPELRRMTQAMNAMVQRVRANYDEQALELQRLQRAASCDALTGIAHRGHFLRRLQSLLVREDGPADGLLVLLRVRDLAGMNRHGGHRQTDEALVALAHQLESLVQQVPQSFCGRLNGSDFAVALPAVLDARATVEPLMARLSAALPPAMQLATGATRWRQGVSASTVLAGADVMLARAESQDNGIAFEDAMAPGEWRLGEDAWRARLHEALRGGWVRIAEFPLVDRMANLIHLECPLRIEFPKADGSLAASHWLPMAQRTGQVSDFDLKAATLALKAIGIDGIPRGINLAAASLESGVFLAALHELVSAARPLAGKLWLEIPEHAALRHAAALRALSEQLRPLGVHVGIEHAGEHLAQLGDLIQSGLDYVKLDAAIVADVTTQPQAVASMVRMLRSFGLSVYAEGVQNKEQADALWAAGIDGLTGPFATG
jgi:EAL domain-containing protein (putative c-di-GMP-specific phosphodiesterase class I)/GGDEF domain-containing protein